MTPFGPGRIKRYKKRSRCFVVNLDWKMGNGKPVKAYLQPNNIVVLQVGVVPEVNLSPRGSGRWRAVQSRMRSRESGDECEGGIVDAA